MGYRTTWLTKMGRASRHMEAVLFALDREIRPAVPVRLLDVGVENGGSAEVWREVLPEHSEVVTVDCDPATGPDLLLDVTDRDAVRDALRGQWFDYIVDDTRLGLNDDLWPFLRPGGVMLVEGPDAAHLAGLLTPYLLDGYGPWLPSEEVLRVSVYPGLLAVEKRHPRATPYMEVVAGEEFPVLDADTLTDAGVKRVVP